MKVKMGQLKTHLSRYVKALRDGGEPLEICVREDTVAYMTAADKDFPSVQPDLLRRRLENSGLTISQWGGKRPRKSSTLPASETPSGVNSVLEMRAEKDW
ncbi:MAG: hypothetical protein O3C57_08385 [Verrucomicrobia bacterium]|nr:hypothetical protein [Verrucomicrobiota bacterium]